MKLEYYPWDCPPDFAANIASRVKNTNPFPTIFEGIQEITMDIPVSHKLPNDTLWVVDELAEEHRRDLSQERLLILTPKAINPGGEALAYFAKYVYFCMTFKDEGVVFVRPVIVKEGEILWDTEGHELNPDFGFCMAAAGLAMTYNVPSDCQDRTCFMYHPQRGDDWNGAQYHFCPAHAQTLSRNAVAYRQGDHD